MQNLGNAFNRAHSCNRLELGRRLAYPSVSLTSLTSGIAARSAGPVFFGKTMACTRP